MIQAFFNGMSGLFSFSKGLRTVSSNVSNMNTPGFRATDSFFRNVGDNRSGSLGVETGPTALRTSAGELRQSGNSTDMAIKGRGFFVVQDDSGRIAYTRAGQFHTGADFRLASSTSGHRLMSVDGSGQLAVIDLSSQRTLAPVATTRVVLAGNLLTTATTHTLENVRVFDASGTGVNPTLAFSRQPAPATGAWDVAVSGDTTGAIGTGTVRFGPDGTPVAGSNTFDLHFTSQGNSQAITFDFGEPGSLSGATHFSSGNSTISAAAKDGSALTGLATVTVDDKGVLQLAYADGRQQAGPQVALALFADESALVSDAAALFRSDAQTPEIGTAGSGAFGKIQGGHIELANVDLAQEFGDLIIIQRGYQASSRVMTVASEMIEQLYNPGRGG